MSIRVKTHHVDITPALKDYATTKASKLDKFIADVDCDVELDIQDGHSDINSRQIAKITLSTDGKTFHAEEAAHDMYAAIDLLLDKISKQLRRHRDKVKDHHRGSKTTSIDKPATETPSAAYKESELYVPKPMDVDQAAERLTEQGLPFLVFRNFQEKINIVYPSQNGEVGLIEP